MRPMIYLNKKLNILHELIKYNGETMECILCKNKKKMDSNEPCQTCQDKGFRITYSNANIYYVFHLNDLLIDGIIDVNAQGLLRTSIYIYSEYILLKGLHLPPEIKEYVKSFLNEDKIHFKCQNCFHFKERDIDCSNCLLNLESNEIFIVKDKDLYRIFHDYYSLLLEERDIVSKNGRQVLSIKRTNLKEAADNLDNILLFG